MPLSHFVQTVSIPGRPGFSALFSTCVGSLCVISDRVLAQLTRGEIPLPLDQTLRRLGLWVSDLEREKGEVLEFVDRVNQADTNLTVALHLGMGCNFACPYCYQHPVKTNQRLTETTLEALVAFLRTRLTPDKTRLVLDLYGGEPLLYLPAIRLLSAKLRPLCRERGVLFVLHLVTNGSLLTPGVVDELLPLGLTSARVTLDGPPETHDRTRPFIEGRGSFGVILANLKAVSPRLKLSVGSNYTEETWRLYPRLLDRLEAEGLGPERLALVHFSAVGGTHAGARLLHPAGCSSPKEQWTAEAAFTLREEVLRRGYRIAKLHPAPCMIDLDGAFTVDWDGSLYKCPGLVGRKNFSVGNVRQGFSDYRESYGVQAWRENPSCRDCVYLPLCFGGCRFTRFQREGRPAGIDCRRSFFDAVLPSFIAQEVLLRKRTGPTAVTPEPKRR